MKNKFLFLLLVSSLWSLLPSLAHAEGGWDNGFYLKSADGQFSMNVGGRIQFEEQIDNLRSLQSDLERQIAPLVDRQKDLVELENILTLQETGRWNDKLVIAK